MSSTTAPTANSELQSWLNRAMEALWLLTVVLVPLAFFDRDYAKSETIIAYVEVPKVALLRTLVGLMAVLWLIDWGLHGAFDVRSYFQVKTHPAQWVAWLRNTMRGHPQRWLFLAVGFYVGTTVLSTALSGSLRTSLWGEVPGQDGYPAYTVAAYVLLFAVIATHLKTRPQLWRLLGAIVAMGVVISGYAVLQNYGHDFLNLSEQTGGRVTAFMGNRIFAAAVMLMTVPITAAATVLALLNLPGRNGSTGNYLSKWRPTMVVLAAGTVALAVQFLGLIFTLSRGPWIGTIFAIALMVGLVTVFVGRGGIARLAPVLGLAGIIAIAVMLNPSIESSNSGPDPGPTAAADATSVEPAISSATVSDPTPQASAIGGSDGQPKADIKPAETPRTITVAVEPTASDALQRLSSIKGVVSGGLTGGRQTHWKVSWVLIRDHPWFEFDSLSLRWLRPLVGYGPDLFRYTYLLKSPPEGRDLYPLEPDHAHNYFIHQTVEQGFLGTLSSLGIFAAVFLAGSYQLLRLNREMSPVHKLLLITLVAVLAGRALEMMVGVARVSDLTVFWVLLGIFAALPVAIRAPEPAPRPIRTSTRRQRPIARAPTFPRAGVSNEGWLWKLAIVTWLIGAIFVLTWMKGISYPRAAVQVGKALEYSRQGDLPSTLAAIDRAIELAPDVPVYYNWRASVYTAYRRDPQVPREQRCNIQNEVSYQICLAALTHESNLAGAKQRPFYYRSRIASAGSAFNLRLDEEAIRHYRESLNMVPGSWALRNNLASALIKLGKPGDALRPLKESLEITQGTGTSLDALLLRASAYLDLGRHLEAIGQLDQALEIDHSNVRAYASRAMAYTNLGQDVKAREDAERAVELGADRAAIDRTIGQIKQRRN